MEGKIRLKKPIIIEFAGISGTGKTYVASKLNVELIKRNWSSIKLSKWEKRGIITKISFDNLISFFSAIRLLFLLKPKNIRGCFRILRRLFTIISKYKFYYKNPMIYIEDEGLFKKVAVLFHESKVGTRREIVNIFFDVIPFPDIVIFLKANPETIRKRLNNRDGKNKENRKEMIEKRIKNQFSNLQTIKGITSSKKSLKLFEMENEEECFEVEFEGLLEGVIYFLNSSKINC